MELLQARQGWRRSGQLQLVRNFGFIQAPYILAHSAEIALQRFHFTQIKGKNTITFDEFMILADKAYGFLKSISKEVDHLKNVYDLLDRTKTGILGYGDYLRWSLKEVAEQER